MRLFLFPQREEGGGYGGQHVMFMSVTEDTTLKIPPMVIKQAVEVPESRW
jgi:hypothetical protein